MELVAARALQRSRLRELFNEGYSDYLVPLELSEAAFADHLHDNGIDLDCSRVAIDERPAAFALIARRNGAGWIGGMGTAPAHRRRGLGERALVAALQAAADRGSDRVWLEVIDRNQPAIALYEKLGFEVVRDLLVWTLPASRDGARSAAAEPDVEPGVEVDFERAHEWIVANRGSREPWQRSDDALAASAARGSRFRGVVARRRQEIASAIVCRDDPRLVAAVQIAAVDEHAAAAALRAAAGPERELRVANVPVDEPASAALERIGARRFACQHEMLLKL